MANDPEGEPRIDIPLAEALRAAVTTQQCVKLYLPHNDRVGNLIPDIEDWIEAAMAVLTDLNGGATKLENLQGMWRSEESGKILTENTTLIYSFVFYPDQFAAKLGELVSFVRKFGRDTNQEEILVEFDDRAMLVRDFSP
jgi:hypothetical protein